MRKLLINSLGVLFCLELWGCSSASFKILPAKIVPVQLGCERFQICHFLNFPQSAKPAMLLQVISETPRRYITNYNQFGGIGSVMLEYHLDFSIIKAGQNFPYSLDLSQNLIYDYANLEAKEDEEESSWQNLYRAAAWQIKARVREHS